MKHFIYKLNLDGIDYYTFALIFYRHIYQIHICFYHDINIKKNLVLHIKSDFTVRLREIEFSAQTSEGTNCTNEGKSATSN